MRNHMFLVKLVMTYFLGNIFMDIFRMDIKANSVRVAIYAHMHAG